MNTHLASELIAHQQKLWETVNGKLVPRRPNTPDKCITSVIREASFSFRQRTCPVQRTAVRPPRDYPCTYGSLYPAGKCASVNTPPSERVCAHTHLMNFNYAIQHHTTPSYNLLNK